MYTRPVTRVMARELSPAELDMVAGATPPKQYKTSCFGNGTTDSGAENLPDDIQRIQDDN